MLSLQLKNTPTEGQTSVYLLDNIEQLVGFNDAETAYIKQRYEGKKNLTTLNRYTHQVHVVLPEQSPKLLPAHRVMENYRVAGFEVFQNLKAEKIATVSVYVSAQHKAESLAFIEGLCLSSYQFLAYRSEAEKERNALTTIEIVGEANQADIDELTHLVEANFLVRRLVNEPQAYLTATKFSEEMQAAGNEAGFTVEVLEKGKIESLNMAGLLAVNSGSVEPPTFTIMEYKPDNATNAQPIVLVGKGVVYDTGGLSLKPTAMSMDFMKCDMGGGAAVLGAIYAAAKNKLPLHIVGLVPATDNRPAGKAYAPGDILRMMNGKTVEVMNTDAEGRLILSDALCYAERYNPCVVVDIATLTGASARALGDIAASLMSNAERDITQKIITAGEEVYERLIEFPLWDEYGDHIKAENADISNMGKAEGGHISAGKFLEHFTSYPWMHVDIAGTVYLHAQSKYRGKYASGFGVRLLYTFLKKMQA